jgi:hypothetical protein
MASPDDTGARPLLDLLGQAAQSGNPGALEIEYWDRGGPPGPGYESDHLVFKTDAGRPVEIYTRARFDRGFNPPFRAEEYVHSLDGAAFRAVCAQILASDVFGTSFDEEKPVPIGDVTKISLTLRSGNGELSKLFYQRIPDRLAELDRSLRDRMAADRTGTPRFLNRKIG